MLNKLVVFVRLVVGRHRIGFRSLRERIAFYLQINPLMNMLFNVWFSSLRKHRSPTAGCARALVADGLGFGALRHMKPESRTRFAKIVLGKGGESCESVGDPSVRDLVATISDQGFVRLPVSLPGNVVEAAALHFAECPHFSAQIHAQSDRMPICKDWRAYGEACAYRYICFRREDTESFLNATSAASISGCNMSFFKQLADAYCGFDTHLYGANTFGTLPGKGKGYAMRVHRDYDDFCCLTIFIAWTDTTADDGATLYAPRTHRSSRTAVELTPLIASAGEVYAVDTFGLHAGNARVQRPRLATWLRFGHAVNLATIQDGN